MGNGILNFSFRQPPVRKFNQSYLLSKELGTGAFSVVRLGINKVTGKNAAVKIVTKKKLLHDDLMALNNEMEILSNLDHPHIIKLYETFNEDLEIFIVTELVEGGELFDRIVSKTNYTEKEARDLTKILLETMAYMHDKGIVHRDLKPENLLLCTEFDDSSIKVADFGFAKRVKDLSAKESACGTPGYVAPEILRGDKYGCEVDIWSVGVICYVLLAGYPPFYDEDQKKLFKKIKEGRYHFHEEYWSDTSPEAIDLIKKMLCLDQKERWTAKQLLEHSWILLGDERLANKNLNIAATMRKFNARRRLRAATDAIIIANRIKNFGFGKKKVILDEIVCENKTPANDDMTPTEEQSQPDFVTQADSHVDFMINIASEICIKKNVKNQDNTLPEEEADDTDSPVTSDITLFP